MANYSLTVSSEFRPFSYQELIAPIQHQSEVQDKLMDQYDTLSQQADVLEAMGQRDKNSGAYSRYKAYSDALRQQADNLLKQGLTPQSRLQLSQMKTNYNKQIVPIQNAWSRRDQEAKLQLQASMSDPTLMFSRDAATSSIDDYLANPEGGFQTVSGKTMATMSAGMAQNLAKQVQMGKGELASKLKHINPLTYETIQKYGLTPDVVRDWKNNGILSTIVDQVKLANGVQNLSPKDQLRAEGFAESGLWQAVGEDKVNYVDDKPAEMALQDYYDQQKQARDFKQKLALAQAQGGDGGSPFPMGDQSMPLAYGDDNAKKKTQDAANVFGFGNGGTNGRATVKTLTLYPNNPNAKQATLPGAPPSGLVQKGYSIKYKTTFFDKNGRLLNRTKFITQSADKRIQKELANYYDNKVVPALKQFGFQSNSTPTDGMISLRYSRQFKNSTNGYVSGIDMYHDDPEDWKKLGSSNAYEVKGYNIDKGNFTKGKSVKLNEILSNVKDAKNNARLTNTYFTNQKGEQGFIFEVTTGDKVQSYFVPVDRGNGMAKAALDNFSTAQTYVDYAKANTAKLQKAQKDLEIAVRQKNKQKIKILSDQINDLQIKINAASDQKNIATGQGMIYLNQYATGSYNAPKSNTEKAASNKELGE